MELSHKDYLDILKFYDIKYSKLSQKNVKLVAEKILAEKLCRCYKKVSKTTTENPLAICRSSVLKRKNLKNYNLSCKKRSRLISKKGTNKKLAKLKDTKKTKKLSVKKIHRRK